MKNFLIVSILAAVSSVSYADDLNICRDKLLNLVGVDASQTKIHVTKQLVGTIVDLNFEDLTGKLIKGGPCTLNIGIYQVGSDVASVSVEDSIYYFNPFNHSVGADNKPDSCANSDADSVSGRSYFQQDSGWHNSYGTEINLMKNANGAFTLTYQTSESGGSDQSITCTGSIQ